MNVRGGHGFVEVRGQQVGVSWLAFFLCFFAWFGIAPLMAVVRAELSLTSSQIGWCLIASVAATVFPPVVVGWFCDRFGPRLTYTWLLVLGSVPVIGIGLASDFVTFLIFRLLIGHRRADRPPGIPPQGRPGGWRASRPESSPGRVDAGSLKSRGS